MSNVSTVSIDDLKVIPYFDVEAWNGPRHISCLSFYVGGKWQCWLPTPNGLQTMQMWPVAADYFGDRPEKSTDKVFFLFHLTSQHISFPETWRAARGLWNDFQNLSTSLAKMRLYFEVSKQNPDVRRFVQTEIEYITFVCRSIFDLLQELISAVWSRVRIFDIPKNRKLPNSFAEIVCHGSELRSPEEIATKFKLPIFLARWYASQGEFFWRLRRLRDRLTHGGNEVVEALFVTQRGFAIRRTEKPWCEFYCWPKAAELQNELVPIRPALCAMIQNVMEACESFAHLLQAGMQLPSELFPGLHFFSHGH